MDNLANVMNVVTKQDEWQLSIVNCQLSIN